MISQMLQDNAKMFGMFFLVFGIDQNVIDEDHYEFVVLRHEYRVHEVHEVGWGICETEGHDQKLIETITSGEGGFENVTKVEF
jgi:hypothetical protein